MKKITSPDNPRLKSAIRLKTSRGRKTQQRIIVFGYREIERAVASGIQPLELFLASDKLAPNQIQWVDSNVAKSTIVYDLPESLMSKLRYGERMDWMVAVAARPAMSLKQLVLPANPLIIILEGVEKPGNIGAVLRTIDGAGADSLLLADAQCDALHPNCVRASQGSVFKIPLAMAAGNEILQWCLANHIQVLSTSDQADTHYADVDFTGPTAIVFGNESTGLTSRWLENPVKPVAIPMHGMADSLNVSVAAGVILYEARNQRDSDQLP